MTDDFFISAPSVRSSYDQQQEQLKQLLYPPTPFAGVRPYCRICRQGVSFWQWRAPLLRDGRWEFTVGCHGEHLSGSVREQSPGFAILEVFCYDEPREIGGPWWWICADGRPIQESPRYIESNKGPAFFLSSQGKWMRRNGGFLLFVAGLLVSFVLQRAFR